MVSSVILHGIKMSGAPGETTPPWSCALHLLVENNVAGLL
jgi:hypothetical protein